MKPKKIELHIRELVLHGFAPADRHRIAQAVESELARSFAEQGAPASLTRDLTIERMSGLSFNTNRNAKPEVVGNQVAQTVYRGLKR